MNTKYNGLYKQETYTAEINQKLQNTPVQAKIAAEGNTSWNDKTWTELAEIIRRIQKNEFPLDEKAEKCQRLRFTLMRKQMKTARCAAST